MTKLAVNTLDVGLAGIEVYDILRDFYDIQTEFGDLGNLLAYVSVGDRERDLERFVAALSDIRRRYKRDKATLMRQEYISPQVVAAPQEAFYAEKQASCWRKASAASARSSSCATRRAFLSSPWASASPARSSTTSATPRRKLHAARHRGPECGQPAGHPRYYQPRQPIKESVLCN